MNRTIKDATVRRYHYESHDRLREHLQTFLDAYNFAKRLKSLRGLTVFEFIIEKWTSETERFRLHPDHLIPGPNTYVMGVPAFQTQTERNRLDRFASFRRMNWQSMAVGLARNVK